MKKFFAMILLLGSLFFSSNAMRFQRESANESRASDAAEIKEMVGGGYNLIRLAFFPDKPEQSLQIYRQYFDFVLALNGFTYVELAEGVKFFEAMKKNHVELDSYWQSVLMILNNEIAAIDLAMEMFGGNFAEGSPVGSLS